MNFARGVVFILIGGVFGVGNFACAKAQAKSNPAGAPLDVPAPPARVLAPVEEPAAAAAAVPADAAPAPVAAAPRAPVRAPVRRPDQERPEPAAPAATTGQPAPAPEPRDLRPASPAADAAAERQARDALARAARDLGRVDYGRLNAGARAQYDQSKRFMEQAQQAVKDRNFVFGATLADKAAALAAELVTR